MSELGADYMVTNSDARSFQQEGQCVARWERARNVGVFRALLDIRVARKGAEVSELELLTLPEGNKVL
jgi:hypothetical protein